MLIDIYFYEWIINHRISSLNKHKFASTNHNFTTNITIFSTTIPNSNSFSNNPIHFHRNSYPRTCKLFSKHHGTSSAAIATSNILAEALPQRKNRLHLRPHPNNPPPPAHSPIPHPSQITFSTTFTLHVPYSRITNSNTTTISLTYVL